MHTCPTMDPGPKPHVGGPIIRGNSTVTFGGAFAARVGDPASCMGPTDRIAKGASTVEIGGQPAARIGDSTDHGGTIVAGCPTVLIGDPSDEPSQDPCVANAAKKGSAFVS